MIHKGCGDSFLKMTFVVPLAEIDLLTLLLSIRKEVACQDIHSHFILNGLFMQNVQQFDSRCCTLLLLQLRKATARPTCQVVAFRESCRSNKGLIFSPDMEVKFIKPVRLEVTSSYIRSLLEGGTPHRLLTVLVLKPKQSLSLTRIGRVLSGL